MSNKILVVGASGNVGHNLVPLLVDKGEQVLAGTRNSGDYDAQDGVKAVAFDYDDRTTWDGALNGVNRVYFFAKNADPEPQTTLIPFIDHAIESGVEHMLLMTAFGVDQAEGIGLREVEKYLISADVAHTILRPNWFMQNFNPGFILPMVQQGGIFLPAGEGKTSQIDVRDIAAVAAEALTDPAHRNQEYPLTGGEAFSYAEAAAILSDVTGRDITYTPISDEAFIEALTGAGWLQSQAQLLAGLFQGVQQGWTAPVTPIVEQITGRAPITFQQFAEENAKAWQVQAEVSS